MSFDAIVANAIESALAAGADEEQIRLMRIVADGGSLTFEDVNSATEATFECFTDNGIGYTRMPPDESYGYPILQYSYSTQISGLTTDQTMAIADECITKHSDYVAFLYTNQPASQALFDEYWNANYRPAIVACLLENGVALPDDATYSEIQMAVMTLYLGPDMNPPSEGPDCWY